MVSLSAGSFFNVVGVMFSSQRLPSFEFLARSLEFFQFFLRVLFKISLIFFSRMKSSIFMLFLRFFLPAELVSNHWDFESQGIYQFLLFMATMYPSLCVQDIF